MENIHDTLEHFIKRKMKKEALRQCRDFLNNKSQLIIYIISEYNCSEARNGSNRFILLPSHSSSGRLEGGMTLITNPEEFTINSSYSDALADTVVVWLKEFFEQDDKTKGCGNNVRNRTGTNNN